jgi:hypothetical protein
MPLMSMGGIQENPMGDSDNRNLTMPGQVGPGGMTGMSNAFTMPRKHNKRFIYLRFAAIFCFSCRYDAHGNACWNGPSSNDGYDCQA